MTTQTDTPQQEPSDAEREAMFREASEKRDAGKNAPVDEPLVESPDDDDDDYAPAVAATPPPPPVADKPAPAAAPAPPAVPAVEKSLDAMTPDELKAYARKVEHERAAAVGRTAKLQREAEARNRAAPVAQPAKVLSDAERLGTAFPELSEAVGFEIEQRTRATQEAVQKQIAANNVATMTALFPTWFETMQSNEFHAWLSSQPAVEQQKYHSDSPADYAGLLRGYEAASQPPTTAPAARTTEAERVAAQRTERARQQLAAPRGSATVGNNASGEPDPETDAEAFFNQRAARRDRARERGATRR